MKDHNPGLATPSDAGSDKGSPESIEIPDRVENVGWQTRPAVPTEAESRLADALQAVFADEIYDLPSIVLRLNQAQVPAPDGAARWTEASFRAEMRRLGR